MTASNPPAPSDPNPTPIFDPNLFPSRHRPFLQFILDHNPCLLFSTVLMLMGCYLINSTLNVHPADLAGDRLKLFSLLAVTNLYEACIIPLGLVLIRRTKGTARDGLWLILFETLFIVNGTFLNVDPALSGGWWLNFLLLALGILKAAIILRGLQIGLGLRALGFLAAQLSIIYGLPVFLSYVAVDGAVSPRIMYGLYWVVGLLPIAYDLLAQNQTTAPRWDLVQTVIRRTYLIAPWLMLVAHLGFSHWAHHSDFALADISPLLFGLAIAAQRVRLSDSLLAIARFLPIPGLLVAFTAPAALWLPLFPGTPLESLSPAALSFAAMLITYAYFHSLFAACVITLSILLAATGYLLQESIFAALSFAWRMVNNILSFLLKLLPTTASDWGILTITTAFLLLGLGARTSLRRTEKPPPL